MGFFADVGEALFGTKTKKQGRELAAKAGTAASAVGTAAAQQGAAAGKEAQYYDAAAKSSMGKNAAEYMQKGQQAASAGAEQAGTAAATAGTQAALRAQRSSGLSKGQAALASGQQAGDIYSQTYQQGLQSGQDRYQAATGQLAGQGAQMAGRQQGALNTQLGAASTQAGIGGQQQQAAQQQSQGTWGTIGTIAGAAAGLLSDEKTKENVEEIKPEFPEAPKNKGFDYNAAIKALSSPQSGDTTPSLATGLNAGMQFGSTLSNADKIKDVAGMAKTVGPAIAALASDENVKENIEGLDFGKARSTLDEFDIEDLARKIRPVKYNYKEGEGTPGEKLGVIAQDLEETPLESMVKETPDGTKMIDTNELSGANLNLIIQLARKVATLEDQLKGVK